MKTSVTLAAILAATAFVFTSATTFSAPEKSQAATCSGYGCDGLDPGATGCATPTTSKSVKSKRVEYLGSPWGDLYAGTLELRWSTTCKTNWARWIPSSYSSHVNLMSITRNTRYNRFVVKDFVGQEWTKMVYADNMQACAAVDGQWSDFSGYEHTICF